MIKVFCAALENSGRNWIQSCLAQHPELYVKGDSFPSQMGEGRHYPVPEDDLYDRLVIVTRDKTCQERGVERRGYNSLTPGRFTENLNVAMIGRIIVNTPPEQVVFVSYEGVLIYRQLYWDNIFVQLGVHPFNIVTDYRDENVKYMNDGNGN